MKFGGHEKHPISDRCLHKAAKELAHHDMFDDRKKVFSLLGVEIYMARAMRYWLIATGLAQVDAETKTAELSQLGKLVNVNDPYYDLIGTAWLLHYHLATNKDYATTWYWFFNKFGLNEFTADLLLHYLQKYCKDNNNNIIRSTLTKDIKALLATYVKPKYHSNRTPEDTEHCTIAYLSLISSAGESANQSKYVLNNPDIDDIPWEVFGYALTDFYVKQLKPNDKRKHPEGVFSFDELLKTDCSPVKVFCLKPDQAVDKLNELTNTFPYAFASNREDGDFRIKIHPRDNIREGLLEKYYSRNTDD